MIDILVGEGLTPGKDAQLVARLERHSADVLRSANAGDGGLVGKTEEVVRNDPAAAFTFSEDGSATLAALGRTWQAGRFSTKSIGELRAQATSREGSPSGRIRLIVLDGSSPATDIGSLQAHAADHAAFQVASQFNCLEATGPWIRPVQTYFSDPTQGPRASISAWPATLLRHYQAPSPNGGERLVQVTDGAQVNLLAGVCEPGMARVCNGYLLTQNIEDLPAFAGTLQSGFEAIRVGVHEGVEVVLGYDWRGRVSQTSLRITQIFSSTLARGAYGGDCGGDLEICRQLLRAAYLGTLLAAANLGRRAVVLTLIGGGVFGNPLPLIWEAILWAMDEVKPLLRGDLAVVVNGRNLGQGVERGRLLAAVRGREGFLVHWSTGNGATVHR